MLRTLPQLQDRDFSIVNLAAIAFFTFLTFVCAKISIEIGPVPFTMQTFAVLLAGMVLGAREGALSQLLYVAYIVLGMPLDARGLGAAALFGPTGGYLIGFVVAAFVSGWLVEKAGERLWQRWLAGIVGAFVIYLFGVPHLMMYLQRDLGAVWATGVAPFIVPDVVKALLAAGLMESGRAFLARQK